MMTKRDIKGKFALKNEEHRRVRSLRLTDSTWKKLGLAAQSSEMTRADWLEELVTKNDQSAPRMTWIKEEIALSDLEELVTKADQSAPCMTWIKEEIVLPDKAEDRFQGKTQASEQAAFFMEDLEALCAQVLKNLRLGKQASGYKAAQKILKQLLIVAHSSQTSRS